MKHKWYFVIISQLIVFSMIIAGCSSGNNNIASSDKKDSANKEPVTIDLAFNVPNEITKEEIAEFEKDNPDIKINAFDGQDYNKLMAMIAADNAPDIMRVSGAFDLVSFATKGIAMNLDPYMEKSKVFDKEDFTPIVDLFRYDGKEQGKGPLYGFVKDWSQDFTLWYNKKLFDEANIPYLSATEPVTWEQLLEISKKLTKVENGEITQFGFMPSRGAQMSQNLLLLQLAQLGKSPFTADFGKADLTTPEAKRIMAYWKDVVDANVGSNAVNQAPGKAYSVWFDDKAAIIMGGNWFAGRIRATESAKDRIQDYGYAPAPVFEEGTRISPTGFAVGGVISRTTEHPEEAWRVFEWFFAGKPADTRAKMGVGLPGFKSKMPLLQQETEWDKEIFKYQSDEMEYASNYLPFNPYLTGSAMDGLIDKLFVPVYFGKSTIDEAAVQLTEELNVLIEEGKQIAGVE